MELTFLDLVKARRSVRSFKPDPVPEEDLRYVLEAARLAPSANNVQPWKFVVVRDRARRRELAEACWGQRFVGEAPVVIVACGLPTLSKIGGYMTSMFVDVSIAMTHLILAAAERGLGTCWIGAFYEDEVKRILGVPDEVRVVALTPLGYPTEGLRPTDKPRKPLSEIVCEETYKEG